jgi:hypothetical protein
MTNIKTREEWLLKLIGLLRPMFEAAEKPLPEKIRVSVGFPSRAALAKRKRVIGECWIPKASADNVHAIFISPCLGDSMTAAETLVHELAHAALPPGIAHKTPFAALAHRLGLVGKPTETNAGPELMARLNVLLTKIGPYPHSQLTPSDTRKKQSTRLIKVECSQCGYTCRITRKWLTAVGAPLCPSDKLAMEVTE